MPRTTAPSYRVVYRNARGFCAIRYAVTFEIWFGRRKIIPATRFHSSKKTAASRRDSIQRKINLIERSRQRILKERREKQAKQRLKLKLAAERERRRRNRQARQRRLVKVKLPHKDRERRSKQLERARIRRPIKPIKLSTPQRSLFEKSWEDSRKALPVFPKVIEVEPTDARRATVLDTLIIPMEPESKMYTKQLVDKTLVNNKFGNYHLAIMNFDLHRENYIPMSSDNYTEAYSQAFLKLIPHIGNYFNEVKKSSDKFILRIKFLHKWEDTEAFLTHGVSYHRIAVHTSEELIQLFRNTFLRLHGDVNDPYTTKGRLRVNYLGGERMIYITGFTLEATDVT